MKLKIKTINGIVHELSLLPTESIEALKQNIYNHLKIPVERQKIWYNNSLLQDGIALQDAVIHDGDVLVLLAKRAPTPPSADKDTTPIPTKSIILEHTSYGKKIPQERGSRIPVRPSSAISNLRTQLNDLMGTFVGFTSGTSAEEEPQEEIEQTSQLVAPSTEVNPEALTALKDMGFQEQRARKALLLTKMNTQLAMEWLLEHGDDADIDEPLTDDQLRQLSGPRAPSVPFVPDATAIAKLKDMGFAEDDIIEALRATNNNSEAACAYLLGERTEEEGHFDDSVIRNVLMNPVIQAGLSNPRVLQALRALIENPSSATQFLSDPEIGPVLIQVHNIIQGGH